MIMPVVCADCWLWSFSCVQGQGQLFAPYLSRVVPLAVASLEQEEGEQMVGAGGEDDTKQQGVKVGGIKTGEMVEAGREDNMKRCS